MENQSVSPPSAYKTRLYTVMFRILPTNFTGLQQNHGRVSFIAVVTKISMWSMLWNGPSLFRFRRQNRLVRLRKTSWFVFKTRGLLHVTLHYAVRYVSICQAMYVCQRFGPTQISNIGLLCLLFLRDPSIIPSSVVCSLQLLISLWWCSLLLPYTPLCDKNKHNLNNGQLTP